jgi:hypothetical protein
MSTPAERRWGGKREPGPGKQLGRPPAGAPPMETVTVRFTKEQIAWLSARPDSFSVTLRRLVDAAMTSDNSQ